MPAAQGEAALVGQGDNVVGVGVLHDKAHEPPAAGCSGRRSEDAKAGDVQHPFMGVSGESGIVIKDRLPPDAVQVVDGDAEADGVRDVRRAGLKPVRRLFPGALLILHAQDHLAAAMPRRHFAQKFAPPVQRPDSRGPAHLVTGKGEEIAAQRLNIHRHVPGALRGVNQGNGPDRLGGVNEVGGGIDRPQRVGDVDEGKELHLGREKFPETLHGQLVTVVDREKTELRAGLPGEDLPRHEIAVVLHLREEDDVALAEKRAAPGLRHEVNRLRGSASEDDLFLAGRVEEAGDPLARAFVLLRGAGAQLVHAAMDVAVVALVVPRERLDDGARLLRSGGVIEIDQRLVVDLLVENRELRTDALPGNGGWFSHIISV